MKIFRSFLYVFLIAAIVTTGDIYTANFFWKSNSNIEQPTNKKGGSLTKEQKSIRVTADDISSAMSDERFKKISRELSRNSLPDMGKKRVEITGFSDAVSFPFKEKSTKEAYDELVEEILRNPVFLDMVLRGLEPEKIGDKTLKELNDFIKEGTEKFEDSYKKGDGFIVFLEKNNNNKIVVTEEYRKIAIGTILILDKFEISKDFKNIMSIKNFALNIQTKDHLVRTEEATYQEDKPALILTFGNKNKKPFIKIGFNKLDKRFEVFKKDNNPKPKKPTPKKPMSKPVDPVKPKPIDPEIEIIEEEDDKVKEKDQKDDTAKKKKEKDETAKKKKKKEKHEVGKDPTFDPVNKENLPHIGTGPNQPTDRDGGYRPLDTKSLPSDNTPILKEKEYSNSSISTKVESVVEEKRIPIDTDSTGKTFFTDPSTEEKKQIIREDNTWAPSKDEINKQEKGKKEEAAGLIEGGTSLNDIP